MKVRLKWLGFAVAAAFGLIVCALGVRVGVARTEAPGLVEKVIANMDPGIDRISPERIDMLLTVEDPTFWTNDGIDLNSPGAGMTTLAQGLGKSLFFDSFRPNPLRKIELMALTRFALVPAVSKRDILRATLASAYLGRDDAGPVIGFAEGAERMFNKPLDGLTDREWLALVAALPAPNNLHPVRNRAANAERVARIERLIAGTCRPEGLRDVMLDACARPVPTKVCGRAPCPRP